MGIREYLACVLLLCGLAVSVHASCGEIKKCCEGKDISCRVEVEDALAKLAGKKKFCYCDQYCKSVGDCCSDYSDYCKAVDCQVGEWQDWGECNKDCGFGNRKRERKVLVKAENTGLSCPDLSQRRWCVGQKCHHKRQSTGEITASERAKIIPAKFGAYRKSSLYNPWKGIRRNLFYHYKANEVIERPAYCAEFEVIRTHKACQGANRWTKPLSKGARVCVECQPTAMKHDLGVRCRGEGVYETTTRWDALGIHGCRGSWVMKTKHSKCSCNPDKVDSFIFV